GGDADEFGGVGQSARAAERGRGRRRKAEETAGSESAGAGRPEAGAQRDQGVPQEPEPLRLLGNLRSRRGAERGGHLEHLPRPREGVRIEPGATDQGGTASGHPADRVPGPAGATEAGQVYRAVERDR